MISKDELLNKAQALNSDKKYSEVIESLPDDLLGDLKDADLYAEKAQAYYKLKNYKLCEEAIEKALNINPNQVKAFHYKGNIYNNSKKYEEAIKYYNKAIENDSNYILSYNGIGNVYRVLDEYSKAIDYYNKAITLDPKFISSYNGLGNTYFDKEDYDNAIMYYKKAIEIDPQYINSYNGLGNAYSEQKEYEKAIEYFNKAIELDSKLDSPYFNRALVFIIRNEYQNAINDLIKYLEITEDKSDYYASQAQLKIEELNKSIASSEYSNILKLVTDIKDTLLLKDSSVVHYTGLSAAKALILEESNFRLSECAFLNDPSEGREFLKFLELSVSSTKKKEENIAMLFTRKPFIGSFVSDLKYDDLTLWRMYGKDNKEEAKGCSITIDSKKLQDNLKNTIISKNKTNASENIGDDFNFYRVAYRTQDPRNPFVVPGDKKIESKLNEYLFEIEKRIKEYKTKAKNNLSDIKNLMELLNSITYLFKSGEYQYEHEIRLVVNGVGLEKIVNGIPKVYIETIPINPVINKITLGPKVERADEWAAAFYYKLDKQGYHPEIYISHLPFK